MQITTTIVDRPKAMTSYQHVYSPQPESMRPVGRLIGLGTGAKSAVVDDEAQGKV